MFYFFMFDSLFSLAIILLWYVFVNVWHVHCLFYTNVNDNKSSSGPVFVHVHINIDNDADYLQCNNSTSSKDLWLLFSTLFYSSECLFQ